MIILSRDCQVETIIKQIYAGNPAKCINARIFPCRHACSPGDFYPFILIFQNIVHDPGDRIGPVGGSAANRHNVDAVDQCGRDRVDIDLPTGFVSGNKQ